MVPQFAEHPILAVVEQNWQLIEQIWAKSAACAPEVTTEGQQTRENKGKQKKNKGKTKEKQKKKQKKNKKHKGKTKVKQKRSSSRR